MRIDEYQQLPGEHIQAFAWRVDQKLRETTGEQEVPESKILHRVLIGLHPSVQTVLPNPPPTNLSELFCFADVLHDFLPLEDVFWVPTECTLEETQRITKTVHNEYASKANTNNVRCYKCGRNLHYAWQCPNPRLKGLRPRKFKRGETLK